MSRNPLAACTPEELVAHARANSPFYQTFHSHLPPGPKWSELPVIDPSMYWVAHGRDRREVLTGVQQDGVVFNSGGTTGVPKHSYYNAPEWSAMIDFSARSFDAAGLHDGDRVATLFASGNLYASLMLATGSLERVGARVVQFPIGYSVAFADVASIIRTFNINVLAGFPTHLLRVLDVLEQAGGSTVPIDRIIYAGELFTPDQQGFLLDRFPGLRIHSAGYASVEAGFIGYADEGCAGSEHRVFASRSLVEILDEETDEPIEETDRPGRIVFTSLIRRLMPFIRYPTGDRARWVDPPGVPDRKFVLLGRAGQSARIAGYNLDVSEVTAWLEPLSGKLEIEQFQIVVEREELLDRLTFRLAGRASPAIQQDASAEILRVFRERRPDIHESVDAGVLHSPRVEWVGRDQLIVSERTGKLLRVVDRRGG